MAWAGELLSIWGSARQTNKQTNKQNTETNKKNNLLMTWAVELVSIWGRSERFPDLEATRPQGCLALSRTTPCIGTCVQHTKSKKAKKKSQQKVWKANKHQGNQITRLPWVVADNTLCTSTCRNPNARTHSWYLSFYIYTKKIWSQEIVHPKVRKLAEQYCLVTNSINYQLCVKIV